MFTDDINLFIFDSNIENSNKKTIYEKIRKLATWFKMNKRFFKYFENLFH